MCAVGLIGAGRMGLPICARLVDAGYHVIVHDRDPARELAVRGLGASWDVAADRVVGSVDVLLTVLPGPGELGEVMYVALGAMRAGSTWIDLTSSSPSASQHLWRRADRRGVETLDAPMGGGIAAAQAGSLQLFIGGAGETVDRHRPLLATLGVVHHVGARGAGYATKLIVNSLWFSQALATGEAFLLAQRAGLDPEALQEAVQASAARSEFTDRDLDALLDGDYLRSFGLDRCCEELEAINELAARLGTPSEIATLTASIYRRALDHYGPQDGELLPIAMLEHEAGQLLRRRGAPGGQPPIN